MNDWCSRTVRACGSGGDLGDEVCLADIVGGEGEDGLDLGVAGKGAGAIERDGGAAGVEVEGSLLFAGKGFGYAVGVAQEEVGGVDQDGTRSRGFHLKAGEHGGGEGLEDAGLLGGIGGGRTKGLVGLDEEDLGAEALEMHDAGGVIASVERSKLAAVKPEIVRSNAGRERVGIEQFGAMALCVELRDLEEELAGDGIPVQRAGGRACSASARCGRRWSGWRAAPSGRGKQQT